MLFRRLVSLDLRLPLLMAGIVVLTTAAFAWSTYRQFSDVLSEASGAELRSNAELLAGTRAGGLPVTRAELSQVAQSAAVRGLLSPAAAAGRAADSAGFMSAFPPRTDSTRVLHRLLTRDGTTRMEHTALVVPLAPS